MGVKQHRKNAPKNVTAGVLTVSTSRGPAQDETGAWIKKALKKDGHQVVAHEVVPDLVPDITGALLAMIHDAGAQVVIVNGGTGITPRDVTIEAVRPLFAKELTAFGSLFAQLSFQEIDAAAVLSRATAGVIGPALVFLIPGSPKAVKLALSELILPDLRHFVGHLV